MEEVSLQIEKITGHPNETSACGVFSGRVSFGDGSIGTLVSCILVKNDESGESTSVVKDIFDLANKKLEGEESGSLEVLKRAGEVSREYADAKNLDASFSMLLFYKNASYIWRRGSRVKVWVYLGANSQELSFEHGSGHLKNGQIILIATEKFLSSFNLGDTLLADSVNLEEVVDGLATEISAKSDQGEIGAALVLVKEGVGADAVDVVEEEDNVVEPTRPAPLEEDQETEELDTSHEIAAPREQVELPPTAVSGSDEFQLGASEPESKFHNPLPKVAGAIGSEASKLKRGDIGAIFRLRRNIVVFAIVVILVLGLSAFFTLRGSANREAQSEFNNYLSTASAKYEEGLGLVSLNREKARELFVLADGEVVKALEIKKEDEDALALKTKIAEKLKETENSSSINFSTLAEVEGQLVSLSVSDGNIIGVSADKIYVINTESGSSEELDGPSGSKSAHVYDNSAFIFDGKSVHRVGLADGASEKIIDGENAQDIVVFLGNVYLLGGDQIYKYVPIEDGYAESVNYLNQKDQFSASSRLATDGSVWVSAGSSVFEYLRGDKQDFAISGLTIPAGNLGELYTDSESENIYVIDSQNSVLLAIDKEGLYKKSYQSGELGKASGLVVDEAAGKFYIAVGSKVLTGSL